jgi:hypothetical protein
MDFENDVKNSQGDRVRQHMPLHQLRRESIKLMLEFAK